jgi:S-adenosylmethionine hydrolase
MTIITLMTDFGIKDGNVGVMKGVIWGIAPDAQIVDVSHHISAQDVLEGAFILGRSAPYFPPGAIHVGVVDPGVGTKRRPIAARLGAQFFVGPDNGLCTILIERAEQEGSPVAVYHLDNPAYWLPEVSNVFHGRDIFSPAAAHLARGVDLPALGTPIADPVRLELPAPQRQGAVWKGQVIHIDHFGNIATNIRREHLAEPGPLSVRLCGTEVLGLVRTFGDRQPGELVALYGSTGNLIVSVVNGDAAGRLRAKRGDPVEVVPLP